MEKAYFNWSGGKDSSLALYHILQKRKYSPDLLLTSVNATHDRISMHGVRRPLLETQAAAIGIPLTTIELPAEPTMQEYETILDQKIKEIRAQGFEYTIFGDIFLEDLRQYREQNLSKAGITALFPLWKINTGELIHEFIELGFKAVVICINASLLDQSFCGRIIDEQFIADLPAKVDPCGENGEFHSFVFDGPFFKNPVNFTKGEIVRREYKAPSETVSTNRAAANYGFWFCDLY